MMRRTINLLLMLLFVAEVTFANTVDFDKVFKVVELMGYEWAKENLIHVPYGLVSLEGGKLSTRSGNIVYAEDILKEWDDKYENKT